MNEHPRPATARKATRHWPLVSGLAAVAIAVALGALILVRHNGPFLIDQLWMTEVLGARVVWLEVPAFVLSFLGGGWFATILVPVVTILILLAMKRRWAAVYYALAVALSALLVQLLKALFDRPRPEEILIVSDLGSFPSGHVANAATIVISLAILIGRTWVWYVGVVYVVLMALSRTYLGAHWVTDTIGGALLGAGIAVIVWAPLASRLNREREKLQATKSASTTV